MSYLREVCSDETDQMFAGVKGRLGFVPNLYRAEAARPDVLQAQSQLFGVIINKEGALSRQLKEYVFLVSSAVNLSTYCATAHCEIIRMLGIKGPEPEQIAADHTASNIPMAAKALLNFAVKLNKYPTRISREDIDALRTFGYSDDQILEAVLVVGCAKFANFVAFGLGTVPDFDSSNVRLPDEEPSAVAPVL